MQLISLRLPKSLIKKIDKKAKSNKQNRSEFIRNALENLASDETEIKSDRLIEVRDELLLAVGQLGDSLRQLPKFIKETERVTKEGPAVVHTAEKDVNIQRDAHVKPTPTSPIKTDHLTSSPSRTSGDELNSPASIQVSEIGWSNIANTKPELTLRPRQEPEHYGVDPVERNLQTAQPVDPKQRDKSIATDVENTGPTVVQKYERRRGQLKGRPIGEERRQSIRLARVLAYKKWDARRLAERLRMPIEIIEHAIEGRKDLASLKVEALLSTWEEEMQHVGWKPDPIEGRR